MDKLRSELVSRLAAVVLGGLLLLGAWKCLAFGFNLVSDSSTPSHRAMDLPVYIGIGMGLFGLPLFLYGLLPKRTMEWLIALFTSPPESHDSD